MVATKYFIEFYDHTFPIDELVCVERFYSYWEEDGQKHWNSYIRFSDGCSFKFPESEYEKLRDILLSFNNKILVYDTNEEKHI